MTPYPSADAAAVNATVAGHETPTWLLDGPRVGANLAPWVQARSRAHHDVYASVKANPAPALLRAIAESGLGLDVASAFDVEAAHAASVPDARLSFCTRTILDEDAERARRCGTVVASDAGQVDRWASIGRSTMGVRVNTGVVAGFHAHVQTGPAGHRFGFPIEDAASAIADARRSGCQINGLHTHLGSDILNPALHLDAAKALFLVARQVGGIDWINLGGGYGVPFAIDEPTYDLHELLDGLAAIRGISSIELRFEPGTHICRDAGWLLTRVLSVSVIDGIQHATVDSSVNHLPGALLYGTQHPITVIEDGAVIAAPVAETVTTVVSGMLMQPGDVLADRAKLPRLRKGTVLAFGLAGAYTAVRATTFNGRPLPAEVWWNGTEVELIRRRRTASELYVETYS